MEKYFIDQDLDEWIVNIVFLNLIYIDPNNEIEYKGKRIDFIRDHCPNFFEVKGNKIVKKVTDNNLLEYMGNSFEAFLNKVIENTGEDQKYLMPYDKLSDLVFNYSIEDYSGDEEFEFARSSNTDDEKKDDLVNRLSRQVNLNIIQAKTIYLTSQEAHKTAEQAQKVAEDAKKVKDKIYTDFIAILGIFSALIFGMFGGFDSLKEILSNLHDTSISTTLICFSSLMLGLLCLIFLLIQSIARITDRDTLNCSHHGNDKKCECSIIKKYPVFICSMLIFSAILIISCIIRFFDHNELYKAVPIYLIIAGILTIIIAIVLYGVFKTNKKKKHSH